MNIKRYKSSTGFTIVELMVTMVVMVIVATAIGAVIVDNQRSWGVMYAKINSDVASGSFAARKKFDSVIRSASGEKVLLDIDGKWIEVYYYASYASTAVDRYGKFYAADGDLNYEYGQLNPKATIDVETVCENVSDCTFRQAGGSVQMILTLDDGTQKNTIVTSAIMHN